MANKQIKDFDLKESIDGLEDLLIQDSNGITKRIKTSKLMGNLDLSNYYTKAEVDDLLANTDLSIGMADYYDKATIDNLLAKKANASHAHSYNDLTDKPTIPSIDGLTTKKELTDGLATKANKSEIPSLEGYATETFVTNKIAEASLSGGEVDLSSLATKAELATKADKTAIPTKTSQLTNDKGYLTSVPSEYVTETELNAKGYLTEHQDISMKANKTELHNHSNKTVLDGITSTKVTEWNNKSTFDGNYNSLTNKPTIPTVPTKVSSFTNDVGYLSSSNIKSIAVVNELPEIEIEGVLYLVVDAEPTVTNLYPSQENSTTSDGFTITFTGRNVTIDGSKDTGSVLCQTKEFNMNLKANKTYYLQFTNTSGSFDDSNRVSQNDGMICRVELKTYDSSNTPIILIDNVERDASEIYDKYTFTPEVDCIKFRLLIQVKKLMTFSNWTCSIVIAEEGV